MPRRPSGRLLLNDNDLTDAGLDSLLGDPIGATAFKMLCSLNVSDNRISGAGLDWLCRREQVAAEFAQFRRGALARLRLLPHRDLARQRR